MKKTHVIDFVLEVKHMVITLCLSTVAVYVCSDHVSLTSLLPFICFATTHKHEKLPCAKLEITSPLCNNFFLNCHVHQFKGGSSLGQDYPVIYTHTTQYVEQLVQDQLWCTQEIESLKITSLSSNGNREADQVYKHCFVQQIELVGQVHCTIEIILDELLNVRNIFSSAFYETIQIWNCSKQC